jgi:PPM family protein phosphatase
MGSSSVISMSVAGSQAVAAPMLAPCVEPGIVDRIPAHSAADGQTIAGPLSDSADARRLICRWAAESDTGLARAHNEDSWLVASRGRLHLLADGMGGYNAGEIASQIAVNTIATALSEFEPEHGQVKVRSERLSHAIGLANLAIRHAAARRPECLGMGTTVVAAWHLVANQWLIGHVGDSRAYIVKPDRMERITRDHSLGQAMLDSGAMTPRQLRAYPMRGVLTRALGIEPEVEVDVCQVSLAPGESLLMCSDGLSDLVAESLMHRVIGLHRGAPAQQVGALVDLALQAGGLDNVTALLICA